ncbi:unnamed protein product [Moneuplotes crassus]|uniref:Uncharacterized protein n=1 Tax=Euplotes crassus TaxID=5936 RepID=A0AAD1UEI6_EUPCR|nr:unnamed protein product [Moneuplotes crassus]
MSSRSQKKRTQVILQKRTHCPEEDGSINEAQREDEFDSTKSYPHVPLKLKIIKRTSSRKSPEKTLRIQEDYSPVLEKFGKPHSKFLQKYFNLKVMTERKLRREKDIGTKEATTSQHAYFREFKPGKIKKSDSKIVPKRELFRAKTNKYSPPAPRELPSEENTDYTPVFSNFVISKKSTPVNKKCSLKSQIAFQKKMCSQTPLMSISQLGLKGSPGLGFYSTRNSGDYATISSEKKPLKAKQGSASYYKESPESETLLKESSENSGLEKSLAIDSIPHKLFRGNKLTRNSVERMSSSRRSCRSRQTGVETNINNIPVDNLKIDSQKQSCSTLLAKDVGNKICKRMYTDRSIKRPLLKLGKYLKLKRVKNSSNKTSRVKVRSFKKKAPPEDFLTLIGKKSRIRSNQRKPKKEGTINLSQKEGTQSKKRIVIQNVWINHQPELTVLQSTWSQR